HPFGQLFSKLLNAITIAAKTDPNPQFNPRLRSAIEKAKENNVPQDNIDRAIKKVSESAQNLEELVLEAYGPGGTAVLIESITDNKNRSISEIKKVLGDNGAKWAEIGSVKWAFNPPSGNTDWTAKFPQDIPEQDKSSILKLIEILEDRDDIQKVVTNAKI
ncbi:MAG: YebC/PmpR family DNA-binding transcriptional regulator, partial [Patescibacteria group bacterium]|nr:YebC/PmpR family DNA-binding transcriptional regulator [Patescibacteria group bacterium]